MTPLFAVRRVHRATGLDPQAEGQSLRMEELVGRAGINALISLEVTTGAVSSRRTRSCAQPALVVSPCTRTTLFGTSI